MTTPGRRPSRLPFDGQASCDCKAVPVPHRVHDACMALLHAEDCHINGCTTDCPPYVEPDVTTPARRSS